MFELNFTNIPMLESAIFSLAIMGSPGPLNMAMMASVTQIGFKRTLPFILGGPFGVLIQLTTLALGLGKFFDIYPVLKDIITMIGSGYLIYIAFKILKSSMGGAKEFKAVSFTQGVFISLSNPKSFINGALGISLFAPTNNYTLGAIAFIITFTTIALLGNTAWSLLGKFLLTVLSTPFRKKVFNSIIAILILVVVAWMNISAYS